MNFLRKISVKIGFTETESKIIFFVLIAFFTGLILNFIKMKNKDDDLLQFDYSKQDSLFYTSGNREYINDSSKKIMEKIVDSNRELLDFNIAKKDEKSPKTSVFSMESVNINTASLKELIKLPGIGIKTAQMIIEYRSKNGNFRNAEELMNIKGIGKIKFGRIRKFVKIK